MSVPKRIASALISSLKGGVVPRVGLPYIAVGRAREIDALLHDVSVVEDGGAAFRLIVGRYGSGKSFLLQTMRNHVMDRNFVVADADLSPERRLQGSQGQGLATYRELVANLATRTRPEGGALSLILDRWVSRLQLSLSEKSGLQPQDEAFLPALESAVRAEVCAMADMVHGYDFSRLLILYCRATVQDSEGLRLSVLRWFRGEYASRAEARAELGVNVVIGDEDWYEYLKLFAAFLRGAGYAGLYVCIDELVNLYKLPNAVTRQYNYEKLLSMYNDALQGKAHGIGILMSGTPQCLEDPRRGIYSYEALRSRLSEGRYGREGYADLLSPVIRLSPLSPDEMLVLCEKLTSLHAELYGYTPRLSPAHLESFVRTEYARLGADRSVTPREIIRDFIELMDVLLQSPSLSPDALLADPDRLCSPAAADAGTEGFADFEL